jgi:hypothetical protein
MNTLQLRPILLSAATQWEPGPVNLDLSCAFGTPFPVCFPYCGKGAYEIALLSVYVMSIRLINFWTAEPVIMKLLMNIDSRVPVLTAYFINQLQV